MDLQGIAAAIQLLRFAAEAKSEIKLLIFDRDKHYFGRSFNTHDSSLLLNTSVGVSSIVSNDKEHFQRFLQSNMGRPVHQEEFVTRSLAGEYLKVSLSKFENSGYLHSIEMVDDEVNDIISPAYSRSTVCCVNERYQVDEIVIATGMPFRTLPSSGELLTFTAYSGEELHQIPHNAQVAIAGTSLSAIDATITLLNNGHSGPIALVSRTGHLPAVRRSVVHDDQRIFDQELDALKSMNGGTYSVDDLVKVFCLVGGDTFRQSMLLSSKKNPQETFFEFCSESFSSQTDWERHIMSFIDGINGIWPNTPVAERARFNATIAKSVNQFISAMPLQNALKIKDAIQRSQLSLHCGTISCAEDLTACVKQAAGWTPTCAIAALGCAPAWTDPFLGRLARNGLIKLNPEGAFTFALTPCKHGLVQIFLPLVQSHTDKFTHQTSCIRQSMRRRN